MLALSVVLMVPVAAGVVGFFSTASSRRSRRGTIRGCRRREALGLGAQVGDALRFFGLVVVANLVALVLYFAVPPLAPFVFWLVNGFLLGREYFALVATRRLGREAAAALRPAAFLADLGRGRRDGGAAERAGAEPRGADHRGGGLHPPVPPDDARRHLRLKKATDGRLFPSPRVGLT